MVENWKTEGARCTKMGADTSSAEIPQMPQNLYAQFVCPSPKVWNFDEKGFIGRP